MGTERGTRRTSIRGGTPAPRRAVVWIAAAAAVALMAPAPAAAQGVYEPPTLRITASGGISLRDGLGGFRIGEDVRSATVRIAWGRNALHPFVQAERFVRPDLQCQAPLVCNEDGWTVMVGVAPAFAPGGNDTEPGLHPFLTTAIGWAFSEEDRFAYQLGIGASYPVTDWLAPSVELRWEELPGIRNVLMFNAGIRLDLF